MLWRDSINTDYISTDIKTWEHIIARESNGQVDAYNPSGASGLFQTMPGWGSTATVEDQIQEQGIPLKVL